MRAFKTMHGVVVGADKETVKFLNSTPVNSVFEFELIATNKRRNRSTKQNAYYWGVVIETIYNNLQNGVCRDAIHTALKIGVFGGIEVLGNIVPARDTKGLNTAEMEQYLGFAREWASMYHGIYIPQPNECGYN